MNKINLKDWWIIISIYFIFGFVWELINANYIAMLFNGFFAVGFYQKSKLVYKIAWVLVVISGISTLFGISRGMVQLGSVNSFLLLINLAFLMMLRQQIRTEKKK